MTAHQILTRARIEYRARLATYPAIAAPHGDGASVGEYRRGCRCVDCTSLHSAYQRTSRTTGALRLKPANLTAVQSRVLESLQPHPAPVFATALVFEYLPVSRANVHASLLRLVRLGLVVRSWCPDKLRPMFVLADTARRVAPPPDAPTIPW